MFEVPGIVFITYRDAGNLPVLDVLEQTKLLRPIKKNNASSFLERYRSSNGLFRHHVFFL